MIAYFYKMTFDISLYFALYSFFLRYFEDSGRPAGLYAFGLLLAVNLLCALSERFERAGRPLRLLALCLPALAFVWNRDAAGIGQFLLPWAYIAVTAIRQQYEVYYRNFKDSFRYVLFVFLIPFLMLFYDAERGIPALRESASYLVVFFTSGVMLLQVLRYRTGTKDRQLFEKHQFRQMIGFFILCLAVTAGRILEFAGSVLWERMLRPALLGLLGRFWYAVQWIMSNINLDSRKLNPENAGEYVDETITPAGTVIQEEAGEVVEKAAEQPLDFAPLLVFAGIVAAVVLFFLLRGSFRHKRKTAAILEEREELGENPGGRPARLKKHSPDPAITVRYQYRSFMRKADAGKGRLKRSDTTEEIGEKYNIARAGTSETAMKGTEEITEIYRRTRYGGGKTTGQEAKRIRELVKSAK
ncbi:MAG: hypothetical protein K2N94_12310 [Lachnospiraceae bacterium]|nr:hypothetical protein [Lachnospiraceae bacterium]